MLLTIDESWKEHLREMDQLRQSVQNASYEQKDPLVIYKKESFDLFGAMVGTMNSKALSILLRGQIPSQDPDQAQVQQREMPRQRQRYNESRGQGVNEQAAAANRAASQNAQGPQRPTQPIVAGPKVGRNDPCPCGSGKKYKNCHGRMA